MSIEGNALLNLSLWKGRIWLEMNDDRFRGWIEISIAFKTILRKIKTKNLKTIKFVFNFIELFIIFLFLFLWNFLN